MQKLTIERFEAGGERPLNGLMSEGGAEAGAGTEDTADQADVPFGVASQNDETTDSSRSGEATSAEEEMDMGPPGSLEPESNPPVTSLPSSSSGADSSSVGDASPATAESEEIDSSDGTESLPDTSRDGNTAGAAEPRRLAELEEENERLTKEVDAMTKEFAALNE